MSPGCVISLFVRDMFVYIFLSTIMNVLTILYHRYVGTFSSLPVGHGLYVSTKQMLRYMLCVSQYLYLRIILSMKFLGANVYLQGLLW